MSKTGYKQPHIAITPIKGKNVRSNFIHLLLLADPSSSDAVRKSLAATSDRWFFWLLVSSGVVALGCVLEISETVTSLKRWVRLKRGLTVSEDTLASWHVPIAAIGLLLVIFGVVGEGVFEGLVSNADTALREHDEQILGQAQTQAGEAIKAAEDERVARVKIEKSMEWRHLSDKAKKALCTLLPSQTSTSETVVITLWSDPEPSLFATEFKDTIGSCRPLPGNNQVGPALALSSWTFPVKFGVWLDFPKRDAKTAQSLAEAIRADGTAVSVPSEKDRQFPASANRMIVVGPRPIPNIPNIATAPNAP